MKVLSFQADWVDKEYLNYFQKVEQEVLKQKILLEKINIDLNKDLLIKFNIQRIPTLILLDNDREISRLVGISLVKGLRTFLKGNNGTEKK